MANKVMYVAKMVHNETLNEMRTVLVFTATWQEACRKAEERNPYYYLVSCEKLEHSLRPYGGKLAIPFLRPAYVDE